MEIFLGALGKVRLNHLQGEYWIATMRVTV